MEGGSRVWVLALMAGWVTICVIYDFRFRRVPNHLSMLGLAVASIARLMRIGIEDLAYLFPAVITLTAWSLAFAFWLANWWGAADAKVLIILSLAFPDIWMLLLMAVANLAVGITVFSRRFGLRTGKIGDPSVPGVPVLGFGWLVWAGMVLWGGG